MKYMINSMVTLLEQKYPGFRHEIWPLMPHLILYLSQGWSGSYKLFLFILGISGVSAATSQGDVLKTETTNFWHFCLTNYLNNSWNINIGGDVLTTTIVVQKQLNHYYLITYCKIITAITLIIGTNVIIFNRWDQTCAARPTFPLSICGFKTRQFLENTCLQLYWPLELFPLVIIGSSQYRHVESL